MPREFLTCGCWRQHHPWLSSPSVWLGRRCLLWISQVTDRISTLAHKIQYLKVPISLFLLQHYNILSLCQDLGKLKKTKQNNCDPLHCLSHQCLSNSGQKTFLILHCVWLNPSSNVWCIVGAQSFLIEGRKLCPVHLPFSPNRTLSSRPETILVFHTDFHSFNKHSLSACLKLGIVPGRVVKNTDVLLKFKRKREDCGKNKCNGHCGFEIPSSGFSFWVFCFVLFMCFPPLKHIPPFSFRKEIQVLFGTNKVKGREEGEVPRRQRREADALCSSLWVGPVWRECWVEREGRRCGGREGERGRGLTLLCFP